MGKLKISIKCKLNKRKSSCLGKSVLIQRLKLCSFKYIAWLFSIENHIHNTQLYRFLPIEEIMK